MIKYIIIMVFINCTPFVQENPLKNGQIEYKYLLTSVKGANYRFGLTKKVIRPTNIEMQELRKIKLDTLMSWLQGNSCDWSANIILYALTDKDANILYIYESPQQWRLAQKKKDFYYWKNYFYIEKHEYPPTLKSITVGE